MTHDFITWRASKYILLSDFAELRRPKIHMPNNPTTTIYANHIGDRNHHDTRAKRKETNSPEIVIRQANRKYFPGDG
jgi:hypothetical protein